MRLFKTLTTEVKNGLVFRSANIYQTTRTLEHLRSRFPDAQITLLLPRQQMEYFSDSPHVTRLCVYDAAQGGALKAAMRVIRELREIRFDLVVILCPSPFKIVHLYDVVLLSLFIPAKRKVIIDGRLLEADLTAGHRVKALFDAAAFLSLRALARLSTPLLLAVRPEPSLERDDEIARESRKAGRVGILVPVLPDISHTFVYREILAMSSQGVDFDVIALEEGDYGILHSEASELLKRAIVVPKIPRTRYMCEYLRFLLAVPWRMAKLLHLYHPYCRGDDLFFLRWSQFHNVFHPCQSFALARILQRRGVTYVHAYGSTYPATRAMVVSVLLGIPFSISTFVDFDLESEWRMLGEKVARAAFVVATTEWCVSRLVAMTSTAFRHKIHRIVLGIDPEYGRSGIQRWAQAGPLIVAVGRLIEKKGFDYLLRALVMLRQRGVFIQCVIIGDGPEKGRLEAIVKDRDLCDCVTFTGALPNEKVLDYLESENILVAPSVYADDGERDGIPTVLLEALICGMAVVSTRISGIPELIEDQWNGSLVPARDERALADAIQRLLENPGLRKAYGLRGREKVRAEFNVYTSSRKLWSFIEQSCKRSDSLSRRSDR